MNNIQKVFNFVAGIAGNIADSEGAEKKAVGARNKALKEGNVAGAIGYDAQALLAKTVTGIKSNIGYALNPEERLRQQLELKEPFLRDMLKKKGQQFTSEQMGWLEQLGYVKDGALTGKAQSLKVEIVVKDPAGNVLSSNIQAQSKPVPYNPVRTYAPKK